MAVSSGGVRGTLEPEARGRARDGVKVRRLLIVVMSVLTLVVPTTPAFAKPAPVKPAPAYSLSHAPGGALLRWNPCAAIHYRVNTAQAPKGVGVLIDVKAAIARVAKATGIRFVYDGPTSVIPQAGYGQKTKPGHPLPLVIAWAKPGRVKGGSSTLPAYDDGYGGYAWQSWTAGGVVHKPRIVSGFVVLSTKPAVAYRRGFGAGITRGELLLHELGHAMGLNHVSNAKQIMYPVIISRPKAEYGVGDRTGLRLVGRTRGCIR